jgi:hypothetical protein
MLEKRPEEGISRNRGMEDIEEFGRARAAAGNRHIGD